MIFKGRRVSLIIQRSKGMPERQVTTISGEIISYVRPMLEIGVDDRKEYRLYYVGIGLFMFAVAVTDPLYKPVWQERQESLKGVLTFHTSRKRVKRVRIDTGLES